MTDPAREPSAPDPGVDVPAWGERVAGGNPPRTTRARKATVTPPVTPPAAPSVTPAPVTAAPVTQPPASVAPTSVAPVAPAPVTGAQRDTASGADLTDDDLDEADGIDPDTGRPIRTGPDPLGVAAVVIGCIGILVLGLVLAVVAGVLAAEAGRRAKEERRSCELAYWGLALAGVDGVWWIVMHFLFDLKVWVG